MKPSVIYSYVVDVLRNCRSGGIGWAASCNAARDLNPHVFACVLAECQAAVEERRDIANFRGVCEDIFEKVLRLRLHLAEASANGINPSFRQKMVSCGLMIKSDQCHPADAAKADPKGLLESFDECVATAFEGENVFGYLKGK